MELLTMRAIHQCVCLYLCCKKNNDKWSENGILLLNVYCSKNGNIIPIKITNLVLCFRYTSLHNYMKLIIKIMITIESQIVSISKNPG